jgi:hypothetical protein
MKRGELCLAKIPSGCKSDQILDFEHGFDWDLLVNLDIQWPSLTQKALQENMAARQTLFSRRLSSFIDKTSEAKTQAASS